MLWILCHACYPNTMAIGLQTDCMVTVLGPMVEAARLPRVCPMALGYESLPCNKLMQSCQTSLLRLRYQPPLAPPPPLLVPPPKLKLAPQTPEEACS